MRCLAALARWEELNSLCKEYWTPAEPAARLEMAPMVSLRASFVTKTLVICIVGCMYNGYDCARLQMLLGIWESGIRCRSMFLD